MRRIMADRADVLPVLGEMFRERNFEGARLLVIDKQALAIDAI